MLVLMRLYAKSGVADLWDAIEFQKRNLYWKEINPLYAIQQERKRYLSMVLDIKNFESFQRMFLNNIATMAPVKKIMTIPLMSPIYFPLPKDHPTNFIRYQVFLRVSPEKYNEVYSKIITLDYPEGIIVTYLSHSFGDDDIIISLLARDRETAFDFVNDSIGKIDGVFAHDISRVIRSEYLLPPDKAQAHKARFLYSTPAGKKGTFSNPDAYEKYIKERTPITIIVRLFAKSSLSKLWDDIETHIPKFESKELVPLYASQQEAQDFISVIFEAKNFEVLRDVLTNNLPTLVDVRKTRTIPMLEPCYYLMPKEHPENLERYLITLQVEPNLFQQVRSKIVSHKNLDNVFLTHIGYVLSGDDDIILSILADSHKTARTFAKEVFEQMEGVNTYNISNQLKTRRLASKKRWKQHQGKNLSSYDKQHKKDYDPRFDWTDDYYEYALISGAYPLDMEQ